MFDINCFARIQEEFVACIFRKCSKVYEFQ